MKKIKLIRQEAVGDLFDAVVKHELLGHYKYLKKDIEKNPHLHGLDGMLDRDALKRVLSYYGVEV